ncbi:MAG TPA: trypsin-like peptidase domain-containing protein [Candidatus Nanoarchaeia archaeon]|nr:trypsin-like peptidase domain-containing protein [Candidatus Nanoarchaeia archaeon]
MAHKTTALICILLFFLVGCAQSQKPATEINSANPTDALCKSPYYEWKTGDCCLDQNANQICDTDEKTIQTAEMKSEESQTAKQIIESQRNSPLNLSAQEILDSSLGKVVEITVRAGEKTAIGSGFVVSSDGYVLTNMHLFDSTFELYCITTHFRDCVHTYVKFRNGDVFQPHQVKLVGYNKPHDIVLLKIDAHGFEHFEFADSDKIKVGDTVFALGNPFGLEFSTSKGVISAKNRNGMNDESITKYLQTDAAINQGNSGGPLITEKGQVVGMNTFGYTKLMTEGLGFALESNTAKDFFENLKQIKSDIAGRVCELSESGTPSCNYEVIKSPRQKTLPDSEIEFSKLDLDTIQTVDGLRVTGFSVTMKSKVDVKKEVCFNIKVIENGIKVKDEPLVKRISLNPKINLQETIILLGIQAKSDAYFEINALECGTSTVYATGYARA